MVNVKTSSHEIKISLCVLLSVKFYSSKRLYSILLRRKFEICRCRCRCRCRKFVVHSDWTCSFCYYTLFGSFRCTFNYHAGLGKDCC